MKWGLWLALVGLVSMAESRSINYEYENEQGLDSEQKGMAGKQVTGTYETMDHNGNVIEVKYIADHMGFRLVDESQATDNKDINSPNAEPEIEPTNDMMKTVEQSTNDPIDSSVKLTEQKIEPTSSTLEEEEENEGEEDDSSVKRTEQEIEPTSSTLEEEEENEGEEDDSSEEETEVEETEEAEETEAEETEAEETGAEEAEAEGAEEIEAKETEAEGTEAEETGAEESEDKKAGAEETEVEETEAEGSEAEETEAEEAETEELGAEEIEAEETEAEGTEAEETEVEEAEAKEAGAEETEAEEMEAEGEEAEETGTEEAEAKEMGSEGTVAEETGTEEGELMKESEVENRDIVFSDRKGEVEPRNEEENTEEEAEETETEGTDAEETEAEKAEPKETGVEEAEAEEKEAEVSVGELEARNEEENTDASITEKEMESKAVEDEKEPIEEGELKKEESEVENNNMGYSERKGEDSEKNEKSSEATTLNQDESVMEVKVQDTYGLPDSYTAEVSVSKSLDSIVESVIPVAMKVEVISEKENTNNERVTKKSGEVSDDKKTTVENTSEPVENAIETEKENIQTPPRAKSLLTVPKTNNVYYQITEILQLPKIYSTFDFIPSLPQPLQLVGETNTNSNRLLKVEKKVLAKSLNSNPGPPIQSLNRQAIPNEVLGQMTKILQLPALETSFVYNDNQSPDVSNIRIKEIVEEINVRPIQVATISSKNLNNVNPGTVLIERTSVSESQSKPEAVIVRMGKSGVLTIEAQPIKKEIADDSFNRRSSMKIETEMVDRKDISSPLALTQAGVSKIDALKKISDRKAPRPVPVLLKQLSSSPHADVYFQKPSPKKVKVIEVRSAPKPTTIVRVNPDAQIKILESEQVIYDNKNTKITTEVIAEDVASSEIKSFKVRDFVRF